jgi:hypothetical protein
MDSPLETALIDGNFVSIRMQRGLSVSDWFSLRVKSFLLVGSMGLGFRSATVGPRVAAVKFLLDLKQVSIHSERRLNSYTTSFNPFASCINYFFVSGAAISTRSTRAHVRNISRAVLP